MFLLCYFHTNKSLVHNIWICLFPLWLNTWVEPEGTVIRHRRLLDRTTSYQGFPSIVPTSDIKFYFQIRICKFLLWKQSLQERLRAGKWLWNWPVRYISDDGCLVAQSCPTLCDPMDCSPTGFSARGILQARILEWVAMGKIRELVMDKMDWCAAIHGVARSRTWLSELNSMLWIGMLLMGIGLSLSILKRVCGFTNTIKYKISFYSQKILSLMYFWFYHFHMFRWSYNLIFPMCIILVELSKY